MGSRKRNIKTSNKIYEETVRTIGRMGQRLKTMRVNGDFFFPCEICKRLFKQEREAVEHFQVCKSQHPNTNEVDKSNEPLDAEMNAINNNIENNETKKCRRSTRRVSSKQSMETGNTNGSVPKRKSIINNSDENNVQSNNFVISNTSIVTHEGNVPAVKEKSARSSRGGKKLTEEEITERLRIISEKLKVKAEVKVLHEDDEEEERREIEDKLMALNKDSEISLFNDYSEIDDRLKEDNNIGKLEANDSIEGMMEENSENSKISNGLLNPLALNGLGRFNPSENTNGIIIITQRPDGQLHPCPRCTEVFLSALDLLRHKREKHTAPKIVMAPAAVKKFYDNPDRSSCPICKREFATSNRSLYIKHLQTHSLVGEYECSVCKKKFKRKDHMMMHKKRHLTLSFI